MKPAAFQATYSDFKLVKTRKVAQLIFEVPIEGVDAALAVLGGMPDSSKERWVGIAPLRAPAEAKEPEPKGKKHWRDLSPSQQAGIRCGEPIFWAFLETKGYAPTNTDEAAEAIRDLFAIPSRSELNGTMTIGIAWQKFDDEFIAWKTLENA